MSTHNITLSQDEYGYVTCIPENARAVAEGIVNGKNLFISIGEEETHYDVLFCLLTTDKIAIPQGGIRQSDLFISIMRKGAFAFEVKGEIDNSTGYYSEKLTCAIPEQVAEFFNQVRTEIVNYINEMMK